MMYSHVDRLRLVSLQASPPPPFVSCSDGSSMLAASLIWLSLGAVGLD